MSARPVLNVLVPIIGTALTVSGLYGVLFPSNMARVFGVISVTPDMTVFYPGIGGRNLAAGIAVWSLFLSGQRRALGMMIGAWGSVVGTVDTYLLLRHDRPVDTVGVHVFNTVLLGTVGALLTRGN